MKRRFGYARVRYRGLAKNRQRLAVLLVRANLCPPSPSRPERGIRASNVACGDPNGPWQRRFGLTGCATMNSAHENGDGCGVALVPIDHRIRYRPVQEPSPAHKEAGGRRSSVDTP